MCLFLHAQTLILSLHAQRQAVEHSKTESRKCNGISQPPLITLWLQTSSTQPYDNMTFRKISTVRDCCLSPPHNLKQIFHRGRPKSFLDPPKHSQQRNSKYLITRSTQHSYMPYNIKSPSDLNSENLESMG